jgi:hypothetical protein
MKKLEIRDQLQILGMVGTIVRVAMEIVDEDVEMSRLSLIVPLLGMVKSCLHLLAEVPLRELLIPAVRLL